MAKFRPNHRCGHIGRCSARKSITFSYLVDKRSISYIKSHPHRTAFSSRRARSPAPIFFFHKCISLAHRALLLNRKFPVKQMKTRFASFPLLSRQSPRSRVGADFSSLFAQNKKTRHLCLVYSHIPSKPHIEHHQPLNLHLTFLDKPSTD